MILRNTIGAHTLVTIYLFAALLLAGAAWLTFAEPARSADELVAYYCDYATGRVVVIEGIETEDEFDRYVEQNRSRMIIPPPSDNPPTRPPFSEWDPECRPTR